MALDGTTELVHAARMVMNSSEERLAILCTTCTFLSRVSFTIFCPIKC